MRRRFSIPLAFVVLMSACPSFTKIEPVPSPSPRVYGDAGMLQSPFAGEALASGSPAPETGSSTPADFPLTLDDLGPVGSAGRQMLAKGRFTDLVLEIHFVPGRRPTKEAISHLAATLEAVTGKAVRFAPEKMLEPRGRSYTISEIQDLSLDRSTHSVEPSVSIVLLFLDGSLAESDLSLGASVGATVAVLFSDKIKNLSAYPGDLEAAIVVHEIGHLLGLINYGYKSPRPREHKDHLGHSSNPHSVMYWAIDRADVGVEIGTVPPRQFDQDDLADLQDLARGKL